jgi:hypothetical protein
MDKAAATDWRKNQRHGQRRAEDNGAEIARWHCHGTTRTKCNRLKCAAVRAQCPFVLRSTVDVVEHYTWQPPLRRPTQIFYVQNARRSDRSRQAIHMTSQRSRVFFNTRLQPCAMDLRSRPAEAIAVADPSIRSKPETKSHVRQPWTMCECDSRCLNSLRTTANRKRAAAG